MCPVCGVPLTWDNVAVLMAMLGVYEHLCIPCHFWAWRIDEESRRIYAHPRRRSRNP